MTTRKRPAPKAIIAPSAPAPKIEVISSVEEAPVYTPNKNDILCGHQNKHYIPAPQVREKLMFCTLPAGHEGNHQSAYERLRYGALVGDTAYWSDAAGKAVNA